MDNSRKIWFITLTQTCNLKCKYCGSDEVYDTDMEDLAYWPMEIDYDLNLLKKIPQESNPIICFYGGEPLMKIPLVYQIMDMFPSATFILQTNGTRLNEVKTEYVNRMNTILISVDGDAERTNLKRGKNTYERAMSNVQLIRMNGYKGDLVARMTISNGSDIFKDVSYLCSVKDFDHVHWQLDVCWDSPAYSSWDFKFIEWRDQNYIPGIVKLAHFWVDEMKKNHKILGIAPFTGMMYSLLTGERVTRVRCGSGFTSFNIATNGDVTGCPIAPDMDIYDNIKKDTFREKDMINKAKLVEPCNPKDCEVFDLCGGRCMYANGSKW